MNDANPRTVIGTLGDVTGTPLAAAAWHGPVTATPSAAGGWTTVPDGAATTTAYTVPSLANNALYAFQARARVNNAVSPASDVKQATPRALTAKPTGLAAVTGENAASTLSWPTTNAAASWEYSKDGGATWAHATTTTVGANYVAKVTGLANGTVYTFKVRGLNANAQAGPASDSVTAAPRLLPAPAGLAATTGDGRINVTWTDPNDSTIVRYEFRVTPEGTTTTSVIPWTIVPSSDASTVSHYVTTLTNGTAYDYHLRAVSAVQTSAASRVTATPTLTPAAPANLAAAFGDERVALTWDDPNDDLITRWEYRVDSGTWTTVAAPATSTPASLTFSTSDWSAAQTSAVKLAAQPASGVRIVFAQDNVEFAPSTLTFSTSTWDTAQSVSVKLRAAPVAAVVVDMGAGAWANATGTTVTSLANGTEYTFDVRAVNTSGNGASAQVKSTPYGLPDAPINLAAAGRNMRVVLAWSLFDDTVTRFEYQYRTKTGQAWDAWGAAWTAVQSGDIAAVPYQNSVRNLTNGTEYQFRVRAVNPAGAGAESEPVAATPRDTTAAPLAPTDVRAVALDGTVQVTWTTPAVSWDPNTRDTSIDGYRYRYKLTAARAASRERTTG